MDPYSHYQQKVNMANNRVYINRDFNRNGHNAVPTCTNSNVMYFNPNFAHVPSSNHKDTVSQSDTVRPRIHVNPNFIRPNAPNITAYIAQASTSSVSNVPRVATTYTQPSSLQMQVTVTHNQLRQPAVSKSRYCLVRQNENAVKPPIVTSVPSCSKSTQQTVKVNKYKLVSLNSVKKSLITEKITTPKVVTSHPIKLNQSNVVKTKYKIRIKASSNNAASSRYKYVRRNSSSIVKVPETAHRTVIKQNAPSSRYKYVRRNSSVIKVPETAQRTVRRISITQNMSILKTTLRQTKKLVRGALKKNNIPCPLFKKYGKCLRLIRGQCDFLHDKKHVSICRKFLKGACHNEHCLLSHDLTDKKMPTCYFYLQGICTKEACPYLHVKLNEKAKICPDFLKGYCEKGDKCVLRHVNVATKKSCKLVKPKNFSSSTSINKSFNIETTKQKPKNKTNAETNKVQTEIETTKDQRYFRDVADSEKTVVDEMCDVIKPTRCKLGTLPSYIHL